ncbi:DUF3632 domain-containing protein [Aspergillus homomorphus CBS 101889]|uniref:Uncharacterized protein n=1 Tax=Aspergillus homomorphus (strain CBS 101889) TaxID=1450537 RepID=A0A395I6Z0_ASPHC|nr:hypothetical protein BO97DRAFT_475549 [Aspergillus homomorphus CBS 101889]RAL15960.1 hypothetical protein BO97DRAFT_475549 [Aspergillus homomorphus CBS 101889]
MAMASAYEAFLAEEAGDEWPPRVEILTAFRSLLLDPSAPVSDIARACMSRVIAEANPRPQYGDLWSTLLGAVERFPEQCDRLVDFLIAIHQLPDCDGEFQWLEGFMMHLDEFTYDYADHCFNEAKRDAERQRFVNANIFTIKFYQRLPRPNRFGSLINRGSWVLRKTLEHAPWENFHHPRVENSIRDIEEDEEAFYNQKRDEALEVLDVRTLNGFVPAAAVWIGYCGKEIFEKEGSLGREIAAYDKWKGQGGWSKERWAFWKERFEWISNVTALDRKTRRIAKETVEWMGQIEQKEVGSL